MPATAAAQRSEATRVRSDSLLAQTIAVLSRRTPAFQGARRAAKSGAGSAGRPSNGNFRNVLVVVRNLTTLNRLLDALPAISSDSRLNVKFVIDTGSPFTEGLAEYMSDLDMEVMTWREARRVRWDLLIAAHVNPRLEKLRGPLVVLQHGAGYSRLVPKPAGEQTASVGPTHTLAKRGKVIPAAIGLSHQGQLDQLLAACPEAAGRAFVMGDPTFDRLMANRHRRDHFRRQLTVDGRRIVVVSSTWGRHSSMAEGKDLALRLATQLSDGWQVVRVLHPNVWFGGASRSSEPWSGVSPDAVESRLLNIPPENGWQAALIAADVVVGDHGSVSFYGAALGHPFLASDTGVAELAPSSTRILQSATMNRLHVDSDLGAQLEAAIRYHDPAVSTAIVDKVLGSPGESLMLLRRTLYKLLELNPSPAKPCIRPLPDPEPIQKEEPIAYRDLRGKDLGRANLSRPTWNS